MDSWQDSIVVSIGKLKARGTPFQEGLSDHEIARIERDFEFTFPPELRFFLQTALPVKEYYVPWRGPNEGIAKWFNFVAEGVLFDVEANRLWFPQWGERPPELADALRLVTHHLSLAPKLIPIGDPIFLKCIPATPSEPGNPVFSIHQTDCLHAGRDCADYLRWLSRTEQEVAADDEADVEPTPLYGEDYREIPLWTEELVRRNFGGRRFGTQFCNH